MNRMKDLCKQCPLKIAALLPKSGTARLVREDAQSPLSAITCSRGQNQTCLETTKQTGPAQEQAKGWKYSIWKASVSTGLRFWWRRQGGKKDHRKGALEDESR